MLLPLPVTDDDVRRAWDDFFTTESHGPLTPDLRIHHDRHLLDQLRKVLVADRQRCSDRLHELV